MSAAYRLRRSLASGAALAAVCAASEVAHAQIGDGWTRLTLTQDYIDTQSMGQHARHPIASFTTSGARYDKDGDTETFELYDPSFNRVEHDTNYHYRTGAVQFEGTVQIYPGVNHQFIVQNFNAAASGPIMALSAYSTSNGRIVKQGGSVEVVTDAFGKDVRVNIVHDLVANTLAVYIDGKVGWMGGGGAGGGGFNFKYGSYGSLGTSTSAKSRWRNVRMWTRGTTGGPAPDAAAPGDAASGGDDASTSRDATGGGDIAMDSDPVPVADGSARADRPPTTVDATPVGRDTAGGSGGPGGAGGSDPGEGEGGGATPPGHAAGCGCRVAGVPSDHPVAAIVAVAGVLLWWGVRRRRRRESVVTAGP